MTVPKSERDRIYKKYHKMRQKLDREYERKLKRIDTLHGREITKAVRRNK